MLESIILFNIRRHNFFFFIRWVYTKIISNFLLKVLKFKLSIIFFLITRTIFPHNPRLKIFFFKTGKTFS